MEVAVSFLSACATIGRPVALAVHTRVLTIACFDFDWSFYREFKIFTTHP